MKPLVTWMLSRPSSCLALLLSHHHRHVATDFTSHYSRHQPSYNAKPFHPFLGVFTTAMMREGDASTTTSTAPSKLLLPLPPMIDVDCNLWHCDLKSLQNNKNEGNEDDNNNNDPWIILREDAIAMANIVAILSPSSTIEEARKGLDWLNRPSASSSPQPPLPVRTTVGVHPYHVNDDKLNNKSLAEHKDAIQELLTSHPQHCAAVGECGLDASDGFPPVEDQLPWFRMQIEVAQELKLPLFVHERLAFDDTMRLLQAVDVDDVPVIIHCFTGTAEQCKAYIERGYSISVSGYILKDSNDNCAEVISCLTQGIIPLDKLMIETDAPYMGFDNCRQYYLQHNADFVASLNSKKRKRLQQSTYPNVPSSLPLVLQKVTECLQQHTPSLTLEQVAAATTQNAQSFFGFRIEP